MFWLPLFWLRGRCHLNVTGLFFLFTFKISLSLVFGSLVITCLGMAFFVFICFVSAKFFYIWGLKSFFSFGHYIFNLFFCSIISLFFKTYSYIYIGLFSISSLVIDIIVGFCGFFFFPVGSNLGNFHWPVFCCIQSSVKPSQWIFLFQLLSYSWITLSYFFACHILILLVGHCGICVLEAVDYKSFSL